MRRRRLLAVGASALVPLGGCSSLAGAIRELEFGEISHRQTGDGYEVTAEIVTDINVEEEPDFHEVILLGYSCATGDLVCREPVGTVTREATQEDPVVVAMDCETLPDVLTFDADPGPCSGLGTIMLAVRTPDGWVGNAFERQCGIILPPDRACEAVAGSG